VFDLDDTLYSAECGMWLEIRARINKYMVERLGVPEAEAPLQRERYFRECGTSLAGLRHDYPDIDSDEYLAYVHDVSYERYLARDDALARMLNGLMLVKAVFTNADRAHALNVLSALGVEKHFDVIVDVHMTNFVNKPRIGAFNVLFHALGAEPRECVLLDDQERNLEMARSLGMATILVRPGVSADGVADFCVPDVVHAGGVLQRLVSG
jgi:putative hydrolase of the HAD superfamily